MRDFSVAGLSRLLSQLDACETLARSVTRLAPGTTLGPLGLPEAVRPATVAALAELTTVPMLWILEQPDEARAAFESLQAYLSDPTRAKVLPAPDALPFERMAWDPATREARMTTLAALRRWADEPATGAPVVVATMRGIMTRTLPPAAFGAGSAALRPGDRVRISDLLRDLARLGYEPVPTVSEPGEVARRGGIVDVFPSSAAAPTRIEWLGDEIESMRWFDPTSQRSREASAELQIVPAREALPERGPEIAERVRNLALHRLHPLAEGELRRQADHLQSAEPFAGIEFFGPLLHPEETTALDYFPATALVITDRRAALEAAALAVADQADTIRSEQVEAGELPPDWPGRPVVGATDVLRALDARAHLALGHLGAAEDEGHDLSRRFGQATRHGGQIEEAMVEILESISSGAAVIVVSRQAPRLCELLAAEGVAVAPTTDLDRVPGGGGLAIVHGALDGGWTLDVGGHRLLLTTDTELFGWRMPHRRRRAPRSEAVRTTDYFAEISPGDYVVHIEHGIGLFRGFRRMAVDGVEREYLHLEYAQGDTLYVPTHQADRVARYVGPSNGSPAVSRLGTADWERAKQRARRAVEDIARELLVLYARREVARRAPFSQDTPWQAEMEAAFPFLETDDQLRAIDDVKRDMESERPMDRLVVGDVGFGKTEVALRAAFKAVMAGRQVAVLAPTTVLAQQHYETFRRRFLPFPVRVEMLSRFRSRAEQNVVVDRLATREIDIVIGTHRLLSADVRFHSLGLLIVDEEHRFGVKHKERLRQLREGIDTLTLTATPIPRTMHMALSGLRDLTTIDTPPDERLPVVTHVGPYEENLVRQAVRRELARRGQVFYVRNRVTGIEHAAAKVRKLVPEARIGIAHGQMREDELARAMLDFVGGVTDVLVCTSIIESGLDIPNANTLIVSRADRFGLAQLHQLRGRVGRGALRAYAYLLYAPGQELSREAQDRLEALADASALGSGFRLAMRDLEIRGAGDILGARQHGQVAAIGLDLYTRLLAQAINKLQVDTPTLPDHVSRELAEIDPGTLPTVDLPLDAYLPETYVPQTGDRTRLYRRMAVIDTPSQADDLARELADRFGPPPREVANLVDVLRLRVLAHISGARSVGNEGGWAVVRWPESRALGRSALKARLEHGARVGRHQVSVPIPGPPSRWLPRLIDTLGMIATLEAHAAASS